MSRVKKLTLRQQVDRLTLRVANLEDELESKRRECWDLEAKANAATEARESLRLALADIGGELAIKRMHDFMARMNDTLQRLAGGEFSSRLEELNRRLARAEKR